MMKEGIPYIAYYLRCRNIAYFTISCPNGHVIHRRWYPEERYIGAFLCGACPPGTHAHALSTLSIVATRQENMQATIPSARPRRAPLSYRYEPTGDTAAWTTATINMDAVRAMFP